ncbi:MAG: hypothetical protein ACK58M_15575 [Acidobacteriota bacterium]
MGRTEIDRVSAKHDAEIEHHGVAAKHGQLLLLHDYVERRRATGASAGVMMASGVTRAVKVARGIERGVIDPLIGALLRTIDSVPWEADLVPRRSLAAPWPAALVARRLESAVPSANRWTNEIAPVPRDS